MASIEKQNQGLSVRNLFIWYRTYRGYSKVVNNFNMSVSPGEKVGLVGESGCGKTTTMKMIMRLLSEKIAHVPEGEIFFDGKDILKADNQQLLDFRRNDVSMISQSPMIALNPVFTVGTQLRDIVKFSGQYDGASDKEIDEIVINAIKDVMLSDPERMMKSYPYQLSGGMRQRICIASALVTPKKLLIADEPCTALDVTVQSQIHKLLSELVKNEASSLIMITHSLGVVRELVDRVYIMYGGSIVEEAVTANLFKNPCHPYTRGLFESVPRLSGGGLSSGIYGYVPDYVEPPAGCRFAPRCPECMEECNETQPPIVEIEDGHRVACFLYD